MALSDGKEKPQLGMTVMSAAGLDLLELGILSDWL